MVNNQNCFALNFGFDQEIPFPTFTFSHNMEVSLDSYGLENHYMCFFVFVGRKYIQVLEDIMKKVDNVSDKFHGLRPTAIFVLGKFETSHINSFTKHAFNETMVKHIISFNEN